MELGSITAENAARHILDQTPGWDRLFRCENGDHYHLAHNAVFAQVKEARDGNLRDARGRVLISDNGEHRWA